MIDETDSVPAQLRALGYPDAHWLAAGMEADVYALDEQTVAGCPVRRLRPVRRPWSLWSNCLSS